MILEEPLVNTLEEEGGCWTKAEGLELTLMLALGLMEGDGEAESSCGVWSDWKERLSCHLEEMCWRTAKRSSSEREKPLSTMVSTNWKMEIVLNTVSDKVVGADPLDDLWVLCCWPAVWRGDC